MTNETPICFSITSNTKTKNEIQIRFSKWCENEKRKLKFISVFQSEAKTKNKICFLMSCENKKCKWHLNSIFPCHRKTVGTKVHAFSCYFLRALDDSNFFSISLEDSSYRESTVFTNQVSALLRLPQPQQRFFGQHSVATLLRRCLKSLQHCSNIAMLCCAKKLS